MGSGPLHLPAGSGPTWGRGEPGTPEKGQLFPSGASGRKLFALLTKCCPKSAQSGISLFWPSPALCTPRPCHRLRGVSPKPGVGSAIKTKTKWPNAEGLEIFHFFFIFVVKFSLDSRVADPRGMVTDSFSKKKGWQVFGEWKCHPPGAGKHCMIPCQCVWGDALC